MVGAPTKEKILSLLRKKGPMSHREIVEYTGFSDPAVWSCLRRYWRKGLILRTEEPIRESFQSFHGRLGLKRNLRSYHLYALRPGDEDSLIVGGKRFVAYDKGRLDKGSGKSKAQRILDFLNENREGAWYSTEIYEKLKDMGVTQSDVMATVRRYEKKGLLYVRGYRSHDRQTPFQAGYLITWVDKNKPREEAIRQAVERTDKALVEKSDTNIILQRVHQIRNEVIAMTNLRDLASFEFLKNQLGCADYEADYAIERAKQLYPDIMETKIFNIYRYYYHSSMSEEDLKAAVATKQNYIRKVKGRDQRIGHNWEACVEWFIDEFTKGVEFWTQQHRDRDMDPRRITIHLIKNVGGRRRNAEVDRVWTVTPGIFTQPITYVLECKWGLVRKRDLNDFFEVLRWSKEFGADTLKGRGIRQGVVGIFAGKTFDPKEKVYVEDKGISLASYARRLNIQLLRAADFNKKLHERGCETRVTVQKICKRAKNEKEAREILQRIWEKPSKGESILTELAEKNQELYEFERALEERSKTGGRKWSW